MAKEMQRQQQLPKAKETRTVRSRRLREKVNYWVIRPVTGSVKPKAKAIDSIPVTGSVKRFLMSKETNLYLNSGSVKQKVTSLRKHSGTGKPTVTAKPKRFETVMGSS